MNNLGKRLDARDQAKSISRWRRWCSDLEATRPARSTLVIWGGEFGRTPMGEIRDSIGRNHHIDAYTMWLAGGGIKPGISIGETDEFGFAPTRTASTFTTCKRRSCTCWAWTTRS